MQMGFKVNAYIISCQRQSSHRFPVYYVLVTHIRCCSSCFGPRLGLWGLSTNGRLGQLGLYLRLSACLENVSSYNDTTNINRGLNREQYDKYQNVYLPRGRF